MVSAKKSTKGTEKRTNKADAAAEKAMRRAEVDEWFHRPSSIIHRLPTALVCWWAVWWLVTKRGEVTWPGWWCFKWFNICMHSQHRVPKWTHRLGFGKYLQHLVAFVLALFGAWLGLGDAAAQAASSPAMYAATVVALATAVSAANWYTCATVGAVSNTKQFKDLLAKYDTKRAAMALLEGNF